MTVLNLAIAAGGDDGYTWDPSLDATSTGLYIGASSGVAHEAWLRFLNVTIPPGSVINSAVLSMTSDGMSVGSIGNIRTKLFAEDVDNAANPTTISNYNAKARTTAAVDWDPSAWVAGTTYDSPDISAVIQEVIDRAGWGWGNALQLLWENDGGADGNRLSAASWNHSTRQEPRLVIDYTPPEGEFYKAIVASADDGYSQPAPSAFFTSTGTELRGGNYTADEFFTSFVRFTNVTIPQGATILSAILRVEASALYNAPATDTHLKIKGNNVDNAVAPTSQAAVDALARTAGVDWDPSAWVVGTVYDTPSIVSIVQAIVDRAGWASGNALQFIIDNDGSVSGRSIGIASFDHTTRQEPRLIITYSTAIEGSSEAIVEIGTQGAGEVITTGGAEATVEVGAEGGTGEVIPTEGSEAAVEIVAEGGGELVPDAFGGAETVIEIGTEGSGFEIIDEGSEATVTVGAEGVGFATLEAGSSATVEVGAVTGAGTVHGPALRVERGSWISYRKLN